MKYILFGSLVSFILILVYAATKAESNDEKEKVFNSVSLKLIFAIILSIILSIAIALNADIPDSIGHGGFTYIIAPAIFGFVILSLYSLAIVLRPKRKFTFGLLSIILNIVIGLYYMISDF